MTIEVFISYAHEDEKLMKKLEKQLVILQRHGYITTWYDRKINAGQEWSHEINSHLNKAHIILLLISTDFMVSNYCYSVEVKEALKRHDAGVCRVIPIILRPTFWKNAQFSKLQALPTNGKPVSEWSNKDKSFLDIAEGIQKVINELSISSSSKITEDITLEKRKNEQIKPKENTREIHDDLPDWDDVLFTDEGEPLFPLTIPSSVLTTKQGTDTKLTLKERDIAPTLTVEQVRDKRERIQSHIKTKKDGSLVAALLNAYTVTGIEITNETTTVIFRAPAKFHYEAMQKENRQAALEWALKIEFGQECRVRLLPPNLVESVEQVEHRESFVEVKENEAPLLTIQQIKDKWEDVKRRVKTKKDGSMIQAVLNGYTIVGIEGTQESPIIAIKASAKFHYEVLQKADRSKSVEWAISVELGQECLVRLLPPNYSTSPVPSPPLPGIRSAQTSLPPPASHSPKIIENDEEEYDF